MSLARRLDVIRARMERASADVRCDPSGVTLVAVTKLVPIDDIKEAYDLGLREFGESRLQEALPKIERLPRDIRWHFIGKLQSNKAKRAAASFDVIHTLENEAQLKEIEKAGSLIDSFIEVNIAEETQKTGIFTRDLDGFRRTLLHYPHVRFRGLMTVGPAEPDPEAMRPFFRRMRELNESVGGEWLSMGMSGDFEVAIQEGSTHIRVGSALFGDRR
jgi:PLP dependent protein